MNKTAFLAGMVLIGALGCNSDQRTSAVSPSPSPATTSRLPAMTEVDRELAKRVQDVLQQDTTVASAAQHVQVHARNGEITLQGSVSTQQDKTALENKAQQVAGVSKVNNQLIVTSASR